MSEVQCLDSTRQGLLDLSVAVLDLFLQCRRRLATLVFGGPDGPLSQIYEILPIEDHDRLSGLIRGMGRDFSSQAKWRFREMEHPPYTFGSWIHPSVTRASRLEKVTDFFKLNLCCLEKQFALEARGFHPEPIDLAKDRGFRKLLETWRMVFCFHKHVHGAVACDVAT